jgi:hypothetical protein
VCGEDLGFSEGTCVLPPDPAAAFDGDVTHIDYAGKGSENSANHLVGDIPNLCKAHPNLVAINLGNNPNLKAGPVPAWLSECTKLEEINLEKTNRNGDLNSANLCTVVTLEPSPTDGNGCCSHGSFLACTQPDLYCDANRLNCEVDCSGRYLLQSVLVAINLGNNPNLKAGPVPAWLSECAKLEEINLENTNRNGDMSSTNLCAASTDLTYINLDSNLFEPGNIPWWLQGCVMLQTLSISSTHRVGDLGNGDFSNLKRSLRVLKLNDNPFAVGPIPIWVNGFDQELHCEVDGSNIYGTNTSLGCILAFAKGGDCGALNLCDAGYTGNRCQTCDGCKPSLMCGALQAGEIMCKIAPAFVAAFGADTEHLDLSNANLVGLVPPMSDLKQLDSLDLSNNPNLVKTDWSWVDQMDLSKFNLYGSNQVVSYGKACDTNEGCQEGSSCLTHCCNPAVNASSCKYCGGGDSDAKGACFHQLQLDFSGWNPADLEDGWVEQYSKNQLVRIPGLSEASRQRLESAVSRGRQRNENAATANQVQFTLKWGLPAMIGTTTTATATPPVGLVLAAAGKDPGVFNVNSKTGEIVAVPQHVGNYSVWLLAHEVGGTPNDKSASNDPNDNANRGSAAAVELPSELDFVVVKSWNFEVLDRDIDIVEYGPNGKTCDNGGLLVDTIAFDQSYTCNCSSTRFFGENCDHTRSCQPNESLDSVGECVTFALEVQRESLGPRGGDFYVDPTSMSKTFYEVGASYKIAPPILDDSTTSVSSGTVENIKFELTVEPPVQGFFLDPTSGEMFFQLAPPKDKSPAEFNVANVSHIISLTAVDAGGARVVETMKMYFRYKDGDVKDYGPNEQLCANDVEPLDLIPFNEEFTCNCAGTLFEGANCAAAASGVTDTLGVAVASVLTAIIVVILLTFGYVKYRQWRMAMQPVDFDAQFAKLVALGLIEPEHAHQKLYPREIRRKDLALDKVVGSGQFGEV